MVAVCHHLHLGHVHTMRRVGTWATVITCAREDILAIMAQLENPTMGTEEMQVVREAQNNIKTY